MAYTINLHDDFISAEELRLMETKQAILEKLRARFGEYANHDGWEGAHHQGIKKLSNQSGNQSR